MTAISHDVTVKLALVHIVRDLDAGGMVTVPGIAERFAVSRRTAQRWLSAIDIYLMPIERVRQRSPFNEASRDAYRKAVIG